MPKFLPLNKPVTYPRDTRLSRTADCLFLSSPGAEKNKNADPPVLQKFVDAPALYANLPGRE
jgi:hypothetical protein